MALVYTTSGCHLASSVQTVKLGEKTTTEKVKSEVAQTQPCHMGAHPPAGATQRHEMSPKFHLHRPRLTTGIQEDHKHHNKDNAEHL